MATVLLDTTVLIDLLHGRPETRSRMARLEAGRDSVYVCAINVEEVVRGIRATERDGARRLIAGLLVAPLGEVEGWRAGEWRSSFASRGRTLSQPDCLIAAAALSVGARLATGNPKDFPMSELTIEHWPVGA